MEAASAEALPAAVNALGGAGAAEPGAEKPGRWPPSPLPLPWGAVSGGAVSRIRRAAAEAAVAARAPDHRVSSSRKAMDEKDRKSVG